MWKPNIPEPEPELGILTFNDFADFENYVRRRDSTWKGWLGRRCRRARYVLTHEVPWWFLHRFHPSHRYHVIRTGLRPGWRDRDFLLGHLMVKLLVDFVERERPFEHFDTEESRHAADWSELKALYDYFKAHPFGELEDAAHDPRATIEQARDRRADLQAKLCEIVRLRHLMWT